MVTRQLCAQDLRSIVGAAERCWSGEDNNSNNEIIGKDSWLVAAISSAS
jgi:hypothetical protein